MVVVGWWWLWDRHVYITNRTGGNPTCDYREMAHSVITLNLKYMFHGGLCFFLDVSKALCVFHNPPRC